MAAAKKVNSAEAYKEMMTSLNKGQIAPIYLLMGAESYYIDKICNWITSNLLTEEEKDFNLTVLYGSDVTTREVILQARRFPIMAERQIIVVRDAQNLKDINLLEKYTDHPVSTTIIVLCYMGGVLDARKKVTTRIAQTGKLFVSESPRYDRDIVGFINDYVKQPEYNAKIDQKAAQLLAAHIGGNLKRLSSEMDKLLLAFAPGSPRQITLDIIEQKVGISKEFNVFELRSALAERNAFKAHQIAKYFNSKSKEREGLLSVLPQTFSFFQNLMLCYYAPKPINENVIMAELGLKSPWFAKEYVTALRNFSARKTIQIISKIREVDAKAKGLDNANTPPDELLNELISFILY